MIPPIASRFVAGESVAEALDRVRRLNERSVGGLLNLLGEHHAGPEAATSDTAAYLDLVEDVADSDLRACVSVKPSQVGLAVGEDVFRENLDRVVEAAAERDVFVWLDMEDHTTTDATLDAYEHHVRERGGGMGVCLQSNLRRTREDLERLAPLPGKLRLVKGAYDEPADVAYTSRTRVNRAYREDLAYAFEHVAGTVAVGSHDPEMIAHARDLHATYGTDVEFQMLMGVREEALFDLAAEYDAWQYVPFGGRWFAYFSRRVTERKENLLFALRAVLGR